MAFSKWISKRKLQTRNEVIVMPRSIEDAVAARCGNGPRRCACTPSRHPSPRHTRPPRHRATGRALASDAIAKFLYARLFDWIVTKINKSLMRKASGGRFVGLLDIYGFEIFKVNRCASNPPPLVGGGAPLAGPNTPLPSAPRLPRLLAFPSQAS